MKPTLILFIALISYCNINAQVAENLASRLAGFEYYEVVKGKDDGKLPLLVAFHFSSGSPRETIADYDSLKNAVRIILPRGNYQKENGWSYFPPGYYELTEQAQYKIARRTTDSLARFLSAIEKRYQSKAIVSGISQGGDICLLLAKFHPALLRASFPFAAVIPAALASEKITRTATIPVYMFQGENDNIVPLDNTRKRIDAIGKLMDIQLATYPGLGHEISKEMKTDYSVLIDQYTQPAAATKQ